MKKKYTRWAIVGDCGLYVGQYLTRKDAIADHVWHLESGLSRFATGGLDDAQIARWNKCKANGDRAVKVSITVLDAPKI